MRNRPALYIILFTLLIIAIPAITKAQGPGFGSGNTPDTPIDGGISILVVTGVGYGIKKINEKRKQQQSEKQDSIEN